MNIDPPLRVGFPSGKRTEKIHMEDLSQEAFPKFIAGNNVALVDFHATWCGPCRAMGPTIEALYGEFAGIAGIAKVDVDESPELAETFGIQSIPTLIFFKNGQPVEKLSGARTRDELAQKLRALL
ncbi:MAG: thioredoxin [Puniceicoccales bacterium]|jgi:thioredoxin 1|nr:thioredoxin [Puniceicoccales bacterium]